MLIPYKIEAFDNGFAFVTDSDIEYRIVFEKHNAFNDLGYPSFEVSFYPVGQKSTVFDPRIKATIFEILQDFSTHQPDAILLYICDSPDNQVKARDILFNRWFNEIAPQNAVKLNRKIIDTDLDIIYYMACVFNSEFVAQQVLEPFLDLEVQTLNK